MALCGPMCSSTLRCDLHPPFMKGSIASGPRPLRSTRGRGRLPHPPSPHVWMGFLWGRHTGYCVNLTNIQCSKAAQHRSPASHGDDQAFLIPPQASTGQWTSRDRALSQHSGHSGCELCQHRCSMTRTTQPVETEALRVCRETVYREALRLAGRAHTPCPGAGPIAGLGG